VTTDLIPPPEAQLIARLREHPPRMSIRQAALQAAISESRWRQIEHGVRMFRGVAYPEVDAPAATIAKMAAVVGATPADLVQAGRGDAAGELEALLAAIAGAGDLTGHQKRGLTGWIRHRDDADGPDAPGEPRPD
jgi:hypothetical protein